VSIVPRGNGGSESSATDAENCAESAVTATPHKASQDRAATAYRHGETGYGRSSKAMVLSSAVALALPLMRRQIKLSSTRVDCKMGVLSPNALPLLWFGDDVFRG
jgi:hypothetical protein